MTSSLYVSSREKKSFKYDYLYLAFADNEGQQDIFRKCANRSAPVGLYD